MDNSIWIAWVWLIAVWGANINDLIRGEWFYHTISGIIFANTIGILSLFAILLSKNLSKTGGAK